MADECVCGHRTLCYCEGEDGGCWNHRYVKFHELKKEIVENMFNKLEEDEISTHTSMDNINEILEDLHNFGFYVWRQPHGYYAEIFSLDYIQPIIQGRYSYIIPYWNSPTQQISTEGSFAYFNKFE